VPVGVTDVERSSSPDRAVFSGKGRRTGPRLLAYAAFLLLLAGGVAWLLFGWGSRGSYIAHNISILHHLKNPPRTHVLTTSSAPYYPEGGVAGLVDPAGYTTGEKIAVQGGTTANAIIRYYRSTLTGWKCQRQPTAGQVIVQCIRGHSYITLNFLNLRSRPSVYSVTVDYDGLRRGG
jgi:hypothetical protein